MDTKSAHSRARLCRLVQQISILPAPVRSATDDLRLCVVTGGSTGIGAKVCWRFASAGWRVLSVARRPQCSEDHVGILSISVDLSADADVVEQVAEAVLRETGGSKAQICLVHAASNYPADSVHSVDADGLARALRLNVVVPALLTQRLVPLMCRGSSVVFVGSTLSEKAVAGKLSYCTAKHAMVGLMRSVAQDLLWSGIHSVLVCPGITDTPMVREAIQGNEIEFDSFVQSLQGRMLDPDEVAEVVWNVSQAGILHGAIIHCNNGQKER